MDENFPLALPKGTILAGQYLIESVLGQGGFGITYKATDHKTKQTVAIKEFFPDNLSYRDSTRVISYPGERTESFEYGKESFLQEAKTLAEFIGNDNIICIHSYFEENGTAYFVMDYIEGTSFDDYIKEKGGKISVDDAERILIPVMNALGAVHSKGIVHRDVTPDNIYITNDGKVMLLDFGAARYSLGDKSRSLDIILKQGFAPKEQYVSRGRQGPFTDIYSLGATFYFAVTGKKPPESVERMEDDNLIPPKNLGIQMTDFQETAILKALNVQPSERFQSMEEFRQTLLNETNKEPAPETKAVQTETAIPASTAESSGGAVSLLKQNKNKIIAGISALVAGAVIFTAGAMLSGKKTEKKAPEDNTKNVIANVPEEPTEEDKEIASPIELPETTIAIKLKTTEPPQTTIATKPKTTKPIETEPVTNAPAVKHDKIEIVGNLSQNIKNGGIYTEENGVVFCIVDDGHEIYRIDTGTTTFSHEEAIYSNLVYHDGILYFLINNAAYYYDIEVGISAYMIPCLSDFGGEINSLYVSEDYYFVALDYELYRVSRYTEEIEDVLDISHPYNIEIGNGYVYVTEDNNSAIRMYNADDFSTPLREVTNKNEEFGNLIYNNNKLYAFNDKNYILRFDYDLSKSSEESIRISNIMGTYDLKGDLSVFENHIFFTSYNLGKNTYTLYHIKVNDDFEIEDWDLACEDCKSPNVYYDNSNVYVCYLTYNEETGSIGNFYRTYER